MWGLKLLVLLILHSCTVLVTPAAPSRRSFRHTSAAGVILTKCAGETNCAVWDGGVRAETEWDNREDSQQERAVQQPELQFAFASSVASLSRPGYPSMSRCRSRVVKRISMAPQDSSVYQGTQQQQSLVAYVERECRREGPAVAPTEQANLVASGNNISSWTCALASVAPSLLLRAGRVSESAHLGASDYAAGNFAFASDFSNRVRAAEFVTKSLSRRALTMGDAHRLHKVSSLPRLEPSAFSAAAREVAEANSLRGIISFDQETVKAPSRLVDKLHGLRGRYEFARAPKPDTDDSTTHILGEDNGVVLSHFEQDECEDEGMQEEEEEEEEEDEVVGEVEEEEKMSQDDNHASTVMMDEQDAEDDEVWGSMGGCRESVVVRERQSMSPSKRVCTATTACERGRPRIPQHSVWGRVAGHSVSAFVRPRTATSSRGRGWHAPNLREREVVLPCSDSWLEEGDREHKRLIPCVAAAIDKLSVDVDKKQNAGSPFQSQRRPKVSIPEYAERIAKYSGCSSGCFVIALVYMDRLLERADFDLNKLNAHRLLLSCMLAAAKLWDDFHYNNGFWAKIGGVTNEELNKLEESVMHGLRWRGHVDQPEFDAYKDALAVLRGDTVFATSRVEGVLGMCSSGWEQRPLFTGLVRLADEARAEGRVAVHVPEVSATAAEQVAPHPQQLVARSMAATVDMPMQGSNDQKVSATAIEQTVQEAVQYMRETATGAVQISDENVSAKDLGVQDSVMRCDMGSTCDVERRIQVTAASAAA